MDTIVYLYRLKQIAEKSLDADGNVVMREQGDNTAVSYYKEEIQMADYKLIRMGVSERLLRLSEGQTFVTGKGFFSKRKKRRERQQELQELAAFMGILFVEPDHTSLVCEGSMPGFARWEFNGYFEADWVRHMMGYARLPHFVILGQAPCLSEILYSYVRNMKSLQWILPVRQYREEQQLLVETLYEEYGLAVDLRLLEEPDYRRAGIGCHMPSVFLDFCEEEKIPTGNVAKGSIWLDMTASEEKRRRMEGRNTQIAYFSLKKEWKQPQKALNYLDTMGKNGYNT